MFAKMVSDMMIKPGLSPVFNNPSDFGLDYENVSFPTSDGLTLRGWLIKGGTNKVVIQSHFGVQCSRAGYTPNGKGWIKLWKEDISFLRQVKHLVENGFSVLLYDFRNHGESDLGTCPWISWGPEEGKDVRAAVDYVVNREGYKDASVGLLSICMGAAATTYAYGVNHGLADIPNIKALIAVQPLHYKEFVRAFGIPGFLDKSGRRISKERLGFDLNERTFLSDVGSITVPTLVMQNKNDPWTDINFVNAYYEGLQVEKEMHWLELEKSRAAAYDNIGASPEVLSKFFSRFL